MVIFPSQSLFLMLALHRKTLFRPPSKVCISIIIQLHTVTFLIGPLCYGFPCTIFCDTCLSLTYGFLQLYSCVCLAESHTVLCLTILKVSYQRLTFLDPSFLVMVPHGRCGEPVGQLVKGHDLCDYLMFPHGRRIMWQL